MSNNGFNDTGTATTPSTGFNPDPQGLGQMPPAQIPAVTTPTPATGATPQVPQVFQNPTQPMVRSSNAPPNQDDPAAQHINVFQKVLRGLSRGGVSYVDPQGNV